LSTPPAIELHGLTKRFGDTTALAGVDLQVREGSIFGFLGPNGAGKTTTLRILTGLARPTSGSATVLGHDVRRATSAVRAAIGFLPDVPGFYHWMSADEFLRFAGRLFGLHGRPLAERAAALLDLTGLTGVSTRIGGFSRGMKQRLGIAQALINAPRLLLLDEPTSALDPIGRKEVLDMIAALAGRTTVFFSTHILSDVERVCDAVGILHHGRVVTESGIEELRARGTAGRLRVELERDGQRLEAALRGQPWVRDVQRSGNTLHLVVSDLTAAQHRIPEALAATGLALRRFETAERSLEDIFMNLVGQGATP
jgi:ABC-2 type transport system ATP-binding protein